MVLSIVLPLLLQLWDKRRLDDEQRARSWNVASWGSALYAFGPMSMLGWSWVTRPRWRRVVFGPLCMGALLWVVMSVDALLGLALGMEPEDSATDLLLAAAVATLVGLSWLALMETLVSAFRKLAGL
jgi:hypothetical protein